MDLNIHNAFLCSILKLFFASLATGLREDDIIPFLLGRKLDWAERECLLTFLPLPRGFQTPIMITFMPISKHAFYPRCRQLG